LATCPEAETESRNATSARKEMVFLFKIDIGSPQN